MQIPSAHLDALRQAGLDDVHRNGPRTGGEDTGRVRRGGDSLELSGDRPGSHAERVARFASRIQDRLAKMAEGLGPEGQRLVGAATEKFQSDIDRIQAALADGTLDRRDLARALSNTMDSLRENLSGGGVDLDQGGRALPTGQVRLVGSEGVREGDANDGSTDAQRIETLAAGITERVQNLAAEKGGEVGEALRNALGAFAEHVQRILAGLADGSLSGDDLERAVQNTLQMMEDDVQRSLGLGDPDGSVRGAFEEFEDELGDLFVHDRTDAVSVYGPGLGVETLDEDGPGLDTTV